MLITGHISTETSELSCSTSLMMNLIATWADRKFRLQSSFDACPSSGSIKVLYFAYNVCASIRDALYTGTAQPDAAFRYAPTYCSWLKEMPTNRYTLREAGRQLPGHGQSVNHPEDSQDPFSRQSLGVAGFRDQSRQFSFALPLSHASQASLVAPVRLPSGGS